MNFNIKEYLNKIHENSEYRFNQFETKKTESIKNINESAYLENPIWLETKPITVLFIDLDHSSKISFRAADKLMAKLYDYFTQNVVDILNDEIFAADYVDIKGDGAFGLFEGEDGIFRAFCAAVTFKTFFEKYIRKKFQNEKAILNCKIAIYQDQTLVKKIGKRGNINNNEVWAGKLINNVFKISNLSKKIFLLDKKLDYSKNSLLIISSLVYKKLKEKPEYAILSCGHHNGEITNKEPLWKNYNCESDESVYDDEVWYLASIWCDECGDKYLHEILKK